MEFIDEIEADLEQFKDDFAVYETQFFYGDTSTTVKYKKTFQIPRKGIYSTFFLFGEYEKVQQIGVDYVDEDNLEDGSRMLVPVI